MRKLIFFFVFILVGAGLEFSGAAQAPKHFPSVDSTKPAPITKTVTPELATAYADAQALVDMRMRELQQTPQYQALMAAQASERATFFFIAAEVGASPKSQPVFDEKTKKLTSLQFVPESK